METSYFESVYANKDLPNSQASSILEERKNNSKNAFVAHLNIKGIKNKFEELKLLNDELKAHNNCIEQSIWPSAWTMCVWTPVFKGGDQQEAKNYRPITSLIAVDKIVELLQSNQKTSHYDETRMTAYRKRQLRNNLAYAE